jgi:hypothetical protein
LPIITILPLAAVMPFVQIKDGRVTRPGRKPSLVCLLLLAAAMAVQGVTPDADELASQALTCCLGQDHAGSRSSATDRALAACEVPGHGPRLPGHDSGAPGGAGREETPDEVCEPATAQTGVVLRQQPRSPSFRGPSTPTAVHPDTSPNRPAATRDPARATDLILVLCRLTC